MVHRKIYPWLCKIFYFQNPFIKVIGPMAIEYHQCNQCYESDYNRCPGRYQSSQRARCLNHQVCTLLGVEENLGNQKESLSLTDACSVWWLFLNLRWNLYHRLSSNFLCDQECAWTSGVWWFQPFATTHWFMHCWAGLNPGSVRTLYQWTISQPLFDVIIESYILLRIYLKSEVYHKWIWMEYQLS